MNMTRSDYRTAIIMYLYNTKTMDAPSPLSWEIFSAGKGIILNLAFRREYKSSYLRDFMELITIAGRSSV